MVSGECVSNAYWLRNCNYSGELENLIHANYKYLNIEKCSLIIANICSIPLLLIISVPLSTPHPLFFYLVLYSQLTIHDNVWHTLDINY